MKPKLHIVLLLITLFGASSMAAPIKIEDRHEYTTSLNSIAYIVMNWYGSMIEKDSPPFNKRPDKVGFKSNFKSINVSDKWLGYRSQYPSNITQVLITHTQLLKLNDEYQFNVSSKISYKNNENNIQTQSLREIFIFSKELTSRSQENKSPLLKVSLLDREEVTPLDTKEYDREHYKIRAFVYAWLGYMDGLSYLSLGMNGEEWLNKASYSLQIGADNTLGSVKEMLLKRRQMLAKGGHLLRTVDVSKSTDDDSIFSIELILEWKGFNDEGKPIIAKIHQELKIQINEDGSWTVISIKEKHLLPTVAPWMGLLC